MADKARNRSKSAGRRRSRSNSKTKPIIIRRKKSVEKEVRGHISVEENITETRISRRSKAIGSPTKDDFKVEKSAKPDSQLPNKVEIENNISVHPKQRKNISIYGVLLFIPIIILLNKMCEKGIIIGDLSISQIELKYFCNCAFIAMVMAYLFGLMVLAYIPIGKLIMVPSKDGSIIKHRCNGILSLIVSLFALSGLIYTKYLSTVMVYENYYFLIGSSITVSLLFSFYVLLQSYFHNRSNITFHPGHFLYNFLIGRDLNTRFLGLDVRLFYELRPGYTGWVLLNFIFCLKDLEDNNYEFINPSLLICSLSQIIYCLDAVFFESDIAKKPFIINGTFGFFHCFGNQVIVPFFFTLTTRTIQLNGYKLPSVCLAFIFLINTIGYVIYRTANLQRNSFLQNPYGLHLSHLKTITNSHGHQILVGGWWGLLRHPNYLGDLIMSISWSLFAGFHLSVCWIFPVYFVLFAIFHCLEADARHSVEHGLAWREYQKSVPYRLIPFVF